MIVFLCDSHLVCPLVRTPYLVFGAGGHALYCNSILGILQAAYEIRKAISLKFLVGITEK